MFLIPASSYRIKNTGRKGRGVLAACDIAPGTVIGDYLGTIIKPGSNDENKNGLYDMSAGEKYDIMGNRKKRGVPLINHACTNNCDAYPYRGHILYFALRKIFKGEELTVNYSLGVAEEKDIACVRHACHCGSKFCTGSVHENKRNFDLWYAHWGKLVKKEFGHLYKKIPGKYGTALPPLSSYPAFIRSNDPRIFPIVFGAETKPPVAYKDATLPSLAELRARIGMTGRQAAFPRLGIVACGLRADIVLAEKISL